MRISVMTSENAAADEAERNGTRWVVWPAMAVGFVVLTVLYQLVSAGALAVNFTTSNTQFRMYSNYLEGIVGAGFMDASTQVGSTQTGVADIAVKTAHLAGLCLVANQSVPFFGGTEGLVLTAGVGVKGSFDPSSYSGLDSTGASITTASDGSLTGSSLAGAVTVSDLFVNLNQITGFGNNVAGLNLGQSADQVQSIGTSPWPSGQTAPTPGNFGLAAQHLNIADFNGATYGVQLQGGAQLPGLKVRAYPRAATQADCPTQAGS